MHDAYIMLSWLCITMRPGVYMYHHVLGTTHTHTPVVSTALPGLGKPVLTCVDTVPRVVECATYYELCVCVCVGYPQSRTPERALRAVTSQPK